MEFTRRQFALGTFGALSSIAIGRAAHAQPATIADLEVRTTAGRVRGRRENGLAVFRGIPFAEQPLGGARFAAPQPARAWTGVREAFSFGPAPPQISTYADLKLAEAEPTGVGDDWLTVNVWTPGASKSERHPVMVWIYGGAYEFGSGATDCQHIARAGSAVVVSFNYRLGIEGFARIDGAPANRGLLDMVAALNWVRENIAAFGGDPDQVTIFGESAGAGSVAALLAMPSAKGLFRRAIVQSVPSPFFSDELARDIAAAITAEAGLRPTMAALAGVDASTLSAATMALSSKIDRYANRWGRAAYSARIFAPVVDGEVLPATPWQALAGGAAADVELLAGHNRNEYRLMIVLNGQLGKIGDEEATRALHEFGPSPDAERAYRAAYPGASAETLYEFVQSDWGYRMPTLHLADAQIAGGGRVHMYELTWPAPARNGAFGACHELDLSLLFGDFSEPDLMGPVLIGDNVPPEARTIGARMRADWTAFASTGDPGWPGYDVQRRLVQIFDVDAVVAPYPEEASRRLWLDYEFRALPLT
jgi:para-nitrobenzyl esterase